MSITVVVAESCYSREYGSIKTFSKIMSGLSEPYDRIYVIENNIHTLVFNNMMTKVFSILLSFILLAGHMNFTIGTHFCGGKVVETKIILGETHLGCGMMDMEEPCETPVKQDKNRISFENVPCCQNEFQTVQVTDDYVKEVAFQSFQVEFALVIIYTTPELNLFSKSTHQYYTECIPLSPENDIQALFQTFLI